MVSTDLLSTLRALNRSDKFHVMQFLISELAQQELDLLKPGMSYPFGLPTMLSKRPMRCYKS